MALPIVPYCTSAQVASFLPTLLKGGSDFTAQTFPTKTMVDQYISWISAQVNRAFAEAGYVVPLAAVTGESWDNTQTSYVEYVTIMGAAELALRVIKPNPSGPGRANTLSNIFEVSYKEELQKIESAAIRFRANYYMGTLAERAVLNSNKPNYEGYGEDEENPTFYDMTLDTEQGLVYYQDWITPLGSSFDLRS